MERMRRAMRLMRKCGKSGMGEPGANRWFARLVGGAVALLLFAPAAQAQVTWAGDMGGLQLSAGAMASGYTLEYGQRKMLGYSAFVDADTKRCVGLEAEGRWLEYHQRANVHAESYSIGARYHLDFGRWQPYAKALVGFGDFNFPYNYAQGRYFTATAGGGLDYHWRRRVYIRAVDFEYQDWPQFTYGAMNSVGVSVGLRVRFY
jgi:hypothetical protein